MSGLAVEDTLELWASLLRDVTSRMQVLDAAARQQPVRPPAPPDGVRENPADRPGAPCPATARQPIGPAPAPPDRPRPAPLPDRGSAPPGGWAGLRPRASPRPRSGPAGWICRFAGPGPDRRAARPAGRWPGRPRPARPRNRARPRATPSDRTAGDDPHAEAEEMPDPARQTDQTNTRRDRSYPQNIA